MVEIAIPCFSSLCERVKRKAEMSSHIGIDPRRRSGREQSCWRRGARRAERYGRLERACIGRSTVGDPRVSCTSCSCSHAFRGRGSPGVMVARASAAARGLLLATAVVYFSSYIFQPCRNSFITSMCKAQPSLHSLFSLSLSLQSSSQSSTFAAQEDARKHIFELIWITMACH